MEPAEIQHSASFATAFPYHRHARARAYIRPIWNPLAEVAERRCPCGCPGARGEGPKVEAPLLLGPAAVLKFYRPQCFEKRVSINYGELCK